jgi:hypothetical protein
MTKDQSLDTESQNVNASLRVEAYKRLHDTFKHIAIISAGSVVILTAFVPRVSYSGFVILMLDASLAGFAISVWLCFAGLVLVPDAISHSKFKTSEWRWLRNVAFGSLFGLALGITALMVFALLSIHAQSAARLP